MVLLPKVVKEEGYHAVPVYVHTDKTEEFGGSVGRCTKKREQKRKRKLNK